VHESSPFGPDEDGLPQSLRGTWLLRDIVEVDGAGTVTAAPYGALLQDA